MVRACFSLKALITRAIGHLGLTEEHMFFLSLFQETGGNIQYQKGKNAYLRNIQVLLVGRKPLTHSYLEAAFELVTPPAKLTTFQVEKLKQAMRLVLKNQQDEIRSLDD